MKLNNTPTAKCLLIAMIVLSTTYTYAGLPKLINSRIWNGQSLTWNDFQVRHISTDTIRPWYISLDIEDETKTAWVGNTRFEYTEFTAYMYPISSWYDPDKISEYDLQSCNILFNLVELNARMLQKEFNTGYSSESRHQAREHAWNEAEQRLKEYSLETDYQRDTVALTNYARNIQRELNMLPRTEPKLPSADYDWHYGFHLGYWNMNPLNKSHNDLSAINGFDFSFIGGYRRLEFGFNIKSGSTHISQSAYFNDDDYVWRADETVLANQFLNLGYRAYSGQYFRLVPFANIGSCAFTQPDPVFPKDSEKKHQKKGLCLDAGLSLDYIMMRDIRQHNNSTEYFLRLTPNISYVKIGGHEIWAANVCLSFCFDFQFLRK